MLSVKEIRISPYFLHAHLLIHTYLYPIAVLYPLDPCLLSLFPPFNKQGEKKTRGREEKTGQFPPRFLKHPRRQSCKRPKNSPPPSPSLRLSFHARLTPSLSIPPFFLPSFLPLFSFLLSSNEMRVATKGGGAVEGGFDRGKEEKKEIYIRDEIIIEARIKGMSRPLFVNAKRNPLFSCSIFVNLSRYNRGGRDFFERGKG